MGGSICLFNFLSGSICIYLTTWYFIGGTINLLNIIFCRWIYLCLFNNIVFYRWFYLFNNISFYKWIYLCLFNNMIFCRWLHLCLFNIYFVGGSISIYLTTLYFVGGSIPLELGEKSGLNGAVATVGLVNGETSNLVLFDFFNEVKIMSGKCTGR